MDARKFAMFRMAALLTIDWSLVKYDAFVAWFMAWVGVCYDGKTQIRITDKGTKVNLAFYIKKVLKPFLDEDIPMLFPGERKRDMVFYHGSASSHTAKTTINCLKSRSVNFLYLMSGWQSHLIPAPMDYKIWVILKWKLQKGNINTIRGLKKVLMEDWQRLDQTVINKTLQSWPKQCRMIYYCNGSHIQHFDSIKYW